uniref:Uncharacterized protein n=1 Tax=Phasianus colchicus TaxID=9054 RepID=A0A669QG82_PHACC
MDGRAVLIHALLTAVCSAAVGGFGRDGPHGEALHNEVLLHEGGGVASVPATAPLLGGTAEKESGGAASGDALSELPRGTCGRREGAGGGLRSRGIPRGPSGAAGGAGARRRVSAGVGSGSGGTAERRGGGHSGSGSGGPSLRRGGLERSLVRRTSARARLGRGRAVPGQPRVGDGPEPLSRARPRRRGDRRDSPPPTRGCFLCPGFVSVEFRPGCRGRRPAVERSERWHSAPLPWIEGGERPGGCVRMGGPASARPGAGRVNPAPGGVRSAPRGSPPPRSALFPHCRLCPPPSVSSADLS